MTTGTTGKTKYVILILLFAGWLLGNIDRFVMNYAVLDIVKDLGLNPSQQGMLLSSFFLGYAIMQMPGGALADKFGFRKVILFSIIIWSIFTGMTGLAWSLASMVVIRFLFGIAEGGYFPSGSKAIAATFPLNERSRAMSLMLSSATIAGIFTPILTTQAMGTIGWRSLFYIIGGAGLIVGFLFYFFLKEPAKASPEEGMISARPKAAKAPLKEVLKTPMIWNLFIAYFSIYAINWGLSAWMPTYMMEARGLDLKAIGLLSAIPAFVGIFGMIFSGYVLDRLTKGADKIVAALLSIGTGILLYLMANAATTTLFIAYQSVVTIFASFIITLIASQSLKTMPASIVGSANGFINTGAQLAGFLTPMLIGFMVQAFGGSYTAAFTMLIGFAVLCAIALITARGRKEESPDTAPSLIQS
ncbi:MFS transporter [Paenibacillus sp. YIM B09110]|uniref:MFS transporter n=1 Tax=Paenibacillus sp. YIM B09110 TaxID=3126102 RepID=UPI00301E3298